MKRLRTKHLAVFAAALAGTEALIFSGVHRLYRSSFRRTDKQNHPPIPYTHLCARYPRETFSFCSGK